MADKEESLEERARKLDRQALDKMGDNVSLATRGPNLIFAERSDVRCPLCQEYFDKRYDVARSNFAKRKIFVLVCHTDKVGILEMDPHVGQWEAALVGNKIACPACDTDMRFFCTSAPFVKAKCPKKDCGATITSVSPKKELGLTLIPTTAKDGEGKAVGGVLAPGASKDALGAPEGPLDGQGRLLH